MTKMIEMLTIERRDKMNAIDAQLPPAPITGNEVIDDENFYKRRTEIIRLYLKSLEE